MKIILFIISLLSFAFAQTPTSGTCGDSAAACTWTFHSGNGTLIISGSGSMNDWSSSIEDSNYYEKRPWESYKYSITTLIINDNIEYIGKFSFYDIIHLNTVTISNSVS